MLSSHHILAIDQGTTNTKAVLVDRSGCVAARSSRPVPVSFPAPGWVEQDPLAIWDSVVSAVDELVGSAGSPPIAALGISNQRESAIVWDRRSGEPAGPCVIWQCRRTSPACDALRQEGHGEDIRRRSGLPIDPLFSASKFRWILDHIPEGIARAQGGDLCVGTVDSWLLWKLTGGRVHATDLSNASRTQILNLRGASWDAALLEIFGIPAPSLPALHPSSSLFGETHGVSRLPSGIPVASLIGDSHAALFGHAAFAVGAVKATYGTGSSIMSPLAEPLESHHGLSTTVAWAEPGFVRYAFEGNITNTGGSVQWLASLLGLSGGSADVAALSATQTGAEGAYLVPAFAGLGAPHWDTNARGILCGLTRGTTAAHIARAAIESIAFQVHDVFTAMSQDAGMRFPALYADGGASRNDQLMQFQADLLECPVIRSQSPDLSALGAAWLAGLAIGFWKSKEELEQLPRQLSRFEPGMNPSERNNLIRGWNEAVKRSRTAA